MKTERNRLCMLDQLFFFSIVFHQLRGWALGKAIEKESVKEDYPLSENTAITAISSLLVLPLCVWQVEAFAYISQKVKVEGANDNTKVWSFSYSCSFIVVFQSLLSSSQRRLCLLFLHLFCHPAKDDFACCSYISFVIQPKTTLLVNLFCHPAKDDFACLCR